MKRILATLVLATLVTTSAFATLVQTSTQNPNPAFPKGHAELLQIDAKAAQAVLSLGGESMGDLLSYSCEADLSKAGKMNSLNCQFRHDLPLDWDWYGSFHVQYVQGENQVSVSQKWVND